MTYERTVSVTHVLSALEGYLHALAMIDENDIVLDVKHDRRTGDYTLTIEKEIE